MIVEGQEEDMWRLCSHPAKPTIFASTCTSGVVRVWDTTKYDVICSCNLGFPITGITYSNEEYGCSTYRDDSKRNFHLAVGSKGGYALGDWHKVAIIDSTSLQPLKVLKDPCAQVCVCMRVPLHPPVPSVSRVCSPTPKCRCERVCVCTATVDTFCLVSSKDNE